MTGPDDRQAELNHTLKNTLQRETLWRTSTWALRLGRSIKVETPVAAS
jgi:hypothetical protein